MKLHITFKQQNPDFDQEYADQYHLGKESENNQKDLWTLPYKLDSEIDKIAITEKGTYSMKRKAKDGELINVSLPHMTILECFKDNEIIMDFAVSKSIIDKTHKAYNEKYDTTRYYFYFKQETEWVRVNEGIFLLKDDFRELIENT